MNRADLQKLANLRIQEAKLLLDNGFHQGAYYLAGYAVECALKACIAKKTKEHDFPDLELVKDSYKHDLQSLLKTAGLEPELIKECALTGTSQTIGERSRLGRLKRDTNLWA